MVAVVVLAAIVPVAEVQQTRASACIKRKLKGSKQGRKSGDKV
jgi:hypothetical protein